MKIEEFWRRLREWCLQAKKGNRNRFVGELWTTQCEDWVFLCLKWSDPFWIFSEISWPDHLWFHKHNMLLWRRRTVCMYIEVTYSVREEYSTWVQTCCTLIYEGGTLFQRRPCLSQTFVINRCSTLWGLQLNFACCWEVNQMSHEDRLLCHLLLQNATKKGAKMAFWRVTTLPNLQAENWRIKPLCILEY